MINFTFEEHLRYNVDKFPEGFLQLLEQKLGSDTFADKIERAERTEDLLREQIYFAQELLDNIESALKRATSLREFRKELPLIIENGYFER